jgi:uncharacterized membrane protein
MLEEVAMTSRAKLMGHPVHPMLIPFPVGLLTTAVMFDIIYLITDRAGFTVAAAYAIAGGIIGGVLALRSAGPTISRFPPIPAPSGSVFFTA